MLLQSIKVVNMLVVVLFLGCAFYSLHVHSETLPDRSGALTIVETPVDDDDDTDGIVSVEEDVVTVYDAFYPTEEWQEIKRGQTIPAGLHVRLNFETGLREAKLMEGDTGHKYWESGSRQGMVNTAKKAFTRDELKLALKDFKANMNGGPQTAQFAEEVKKKFKSYKELKSEFAKMNIAIKTDGEIITDLVKEFKGSESNVDLKIVLLEELEYHLHNIDSAVVFCDLGGMPLLLKCLNDTSPEADRVLGATALVLGGALQSNPKVQISAIEHGAMQQLLKVLSISESHSIRRKILYSISSLSRHFPFAQKKFLELGGLAPLKKFFTDSGPESEKLQLKAITFLNDLLTEKVLSETHADDEDPVEMERLKQYKEIDLKSAMVDGGWCELIPQLLNNPDHDTREKVLYAMSTLADDCRTTFTSFAPNLDKLRNEYKILAEGETDNEDDYFKNISELVYMILNSVTARDEL